MGYDFQASQSPQDKWARRVSNCFKQRKAIQTPTLSSLKTPLSIFQTLEFRPEKQKYTHLERKLTNGIRRHWCTITDEPLRLPVVRSSYDFVLNSRGTHAERRAKVKREEYYASL